MQRPQALVYRAEGTKGEGLSEAVAELLKTSPYHFHTHFVGPDEDEDLDEDSLSEAVLLAMPGGPDLDTAYEEIKDVKKDIQTFVRNGGRYLGICLGMYLAGHSPGLGLLPKGADTDSECEQKGAQVTTDEDAVIQIDYTYTHGPKGGQTHRGQWIYFQEGPFVHNFKETEISHILGTYSSSGRIAATLNKYGNGWVGLIGPHPEADQTWFDDEDLKAPQGLRYDIGYDLIQALMDGQVMAPDQEAQPHVSVEHSHNRIAGIEKSTILTKLSNIFEK